MCKVLDQLALISGGKLTDVNHKAIYRGIGKDMEANRAPMATTFYDSSGSFEYTTDCYYSEQF